tara:strand:+ start:719 stop:874 length:156 start_codon:yes stop_codon:yes gene_type:complete
MTIFSPNLIAAAIAYFGTNMAINNSPRGWYGVFAAAVVGVLVDIFYDIKGE